MKVFADRVTATAISGAEGQLLEMKTFVYDHGKVLDVVLCVTQGRLYGDNPTVWKVYHFDTATGNYIDTWTYGEIFGFTQQELADMARPAGADEASLTVYFDLDGRLWAVVMGQIVLLN